MDRDQSGSRVAFPPPATLPPREAHLDPGSCRAGRGEELSKPSNLFRDATRDACAAHGTVVKSLSQEPTTRCSGKSDARFTFRHRGALPNSLKAFARGLNRLDRPASTPKNKKEEWERIAQQGAFGR